MLEFLSFIIINKIKSLSKGAAALDVSDAVVLFLRDRGTLPGGRIAEPPGVGCVSSGMGGTPADSRCAGNSDEPQDSGLSQQRLRSFA